MIDPSFTSTLVPMPSSDFPSTTAAILQLRAEIMAQDWQLSPQRISRLRAAFACLSSFFVNRSHVLALLKMAISVVDHIKHQGPQPKALDFLKEDMAHIVSLYEDESYDPDKEKEIVSRAYKRFLRLNISLIKGNNQASKQDKNASELFDKLALLLKETAHLPRLLEQTGTLTLEERNKAASLLNEISSTINAVWAKFPSPDH